MNYSPFNLATTNKTSIVVDEEAIDLNWKPDREIPLWEPPDRVRPFEETKRIYIDIETSGLDPETDRLYMFGCYHDGYTTSTAIEDRYFIQANTNEKKILTSLIDYLEDRKPEMLIGHNLFSFDLPFIMRRCEKHGVRHPFRFGRFPTNITSASMNGSPISFIAVYWNGVEILDTLHQAAIYDKINANLPNYTLKDVALHIGARDERRLELSHSEILECWQRRDFQRICDYLMFDLQDTKALADFFLPSVYYQLEVVPMRLQRLAVASPAAKWESIIERHYAEKHGTSYQYHDTPGWLPHNDAKRDFEGGMVWCKPGIYTNVSKFDYSSLYPSIQLRYQLCSPKDTDMVNLQVLRYLKARRLELKKLAAETNHPRFKAEDKSIKVLINGSFGFCGTGGYAFNSMHAAALITAHGRKLCKMMEQIIIDNGGTLISSDTDGTYFCSDDPEFDPQHICDLINTALPDGLKIELEIRGVNAYFPKAKNYALFMNDGKLITKGVFRKRNRSKLQKNFPIEYLKKYFENPDHADRYFHETLEKIKSGVFPIDEIMIREKISKADKVKTAAGLGFPGDIVQYYFAEECRYHKRTGKKLKSSKTPVSFDSGVPYWIEYYVADLIAMRDEILEVANAEPPQVRIKQLELAL